MHENFYHKVKVYYEDTDAGGIVYYANYLKYLERARTEMIYSLGLSHSILKEKYGFQIVVSNCNIAFKKSAHFEDNLKIDTELKSLSVVKLEMHQKIYKLASIKTKNSEKMLVDGKITLACINDSGKPHKMPEEAFALFKSCY